MIIKMLLVIQCYSAVVISDRRGSGHGGRTEGFPRERGTVQHESSVPLSLFFRHDGSVGNSGAANSSPLRCNSASITSKSKSSLHVHASLMLLSTIVVTAAVTVVAMTVYGIASFGDGLMFQILLQMCSRIDHSVCDGDISTSTLSLSLSALFTNPIQLWILKDHADWRLGRHLAFFQAIGVAVGVRVLFISKSLLLPHLLGLLLFLILCQKVMSDVCALSQDTPRQIIYGQVYAFESAKHYVVVWLTGLTSGLLSGNSNMF